MRAGQPKRFNSGEQLIELFEQFCNEIIQNDFYRVPNQTNFCKWLQDNYNSVDRKTIYTSLNKYFPSIKKQFEQIQGDVIAEGSMLGHYQPTMSIFALKNWCKWADKQEIVEKVEEDDDGFIEALNGKAQEDWSEHDETENDDI